MAHPTATPSSTDDSLIGRVLDGRYRIVEKIAAGGMGKVYRAVQEPLGRTVAIKILTLDPRDAAADTFRQRFFREASICARLKHPNTVRIHDYGQTKDDIYYIAMEFLEGETLRDALTPGVPMDPLRVIDLMTQICASLSEAHSMGLIHRDLKPSNVILTRHADGKEYIKVLDFGLVKDVESTIDGPTATETGMIVGSPSYMSPEQILQQDLTARSDIYSLGVMLYVMLTGRKPFRQESLAAVIHRHLNAPPPSFAKINPGATIPPNLEWVTMTCLSKDPDGRFTTAGELVRALQACALEVTGRFSKIEMSIANGQLILPGNIENAVSSFPRSRPIGTSSLTQPSLARQTEPSTSRTRVPWLALMMGLPTVGIIGLIFLGLLTGIGLTTLLMGSQMTSRRVIEPAVELPSPVPKPDPAPPPVQPEPEPEPEPVARPTPRPRPRPRPSPKPVARPKPGPVAPVPAPEPVVPEPAPEPVTPEPEPKPSTDAWDVGGTDLEDPWED